MIELELKGLYISQKHIEECIKKYNNEIRKSELSSPVFHIVATEKVIEIDIIFFAYLLLFKKLTPNLKIILTLSLNTKKDDIIYKIRQYLAHSQLLSGINLLEFRYLEDEKIKTFKYLNSWIVWSEKFIPILFIDNANLNLLFKEKQSFNDIKNINTYSQNNEDLYQNFRSILIGKFNTDLRNNISLFCQLSFYKALSEAKILNIYLYPNFHNGEILDDTKRKENNIQAGYLKDDTLDYFNKIKNIFDDVIERPPVFQFLFATLLSSELLGNSLNDNTKEQFILTITNIHKFLYELVLGLTELADNIVKHSEDKIGVITGRIFKQEMLIELKSNESNSHNIIENYITLSSKNEDNNKINFLDINVIDMGRIGVITKLIEDISKNNNDYLSIQNKLIKFKNLIDPNEPITLNHQAKRATAHLGLLIFSKLIEHNNAFMRAGTYSHDFGKRDNVIVYPKNFPLEVEADETALVPEGTCYQALIPFLPTKSLQPYLPSNLFELPTESTTQDIKSIESLLPYSVEELDGNTDYENDSSKVYIIKPTINSTNNTEEESMLWNSIIDKIKFTKKVNRKSKCFIAINLENTKINGSALFRLLGKWELEFSGFPLIIYNITVDLYSELFKINENYYQKNNQSLPYWNNNSLVLIYSYKLTKNGKFYFSDILWGNTFDAFVNANQISRKTNFNSTLIFNNKEFDKTLSKKELNCLSKLRVFYNNSSLLPFDLLLESSDGNTLFESTALVLLQNEIIKK